MRGMKEEMDKLRAAAADRERLSMTAQSLEDRLKERETQVRMPFCNNIKTVSCFGFFFSVLFFLSYGCFSFSPFLTTNGGRGDRRLIFMISAEPVKSESAFHPTTVRRNLNNQYVLSWYPLCHRVICERRKPT